MDIIIGKTSGFCYGVKRAVENTEKELKKNNKQIYCLGELVHNKDVTNELEQKGLSFIDDIEEARGTTIIRAHGIKKEIYEKAQRNNIDLIDLTCPMVSKIHMIAEEYGNKGYYIFLVGKASHPEVIGTYSFCGEKASVVESQKDIKKALGELKKSNLKNLLIIAQTTYNLKEFEKIIDSIKNSIDKDIRLEIRNTICLATEQRQKETEELSKIVELMIIVGGKNSSNTSKLYDISINNCKNVMFVENEKDIDISEISEFQKIGIMAGASTPQKSVEKIIEKIKSTDESVKKGEVMRRKVIAGNWKMNMLPNEAIEYIEKLSKLVKDTENEVILCVPYTDLFYALLTAQNTNIKIGAQNMHFEESGAYTGEVSAKMLKSINVEYVIIGHSERRQYFNETDESVNKKVKMALKNGLKPIICVGETLEQREAGNTAEVITKQTELALEGLEENELKEIIIAYEPIWAIGTGKTATSEDANNSIKEIRNKIATIYGQNIANGVIIQYGGSVKSKNAKELFTMSDIDGGLVGGASLDPEEFSKIVEYDK